MTTKYIKTLLFASLIVALILPFSGMNQVQADMPNNIRDKTNEINAHNEVLKVKVDQYKNHMERFIALSEQIEEKKQNNQSTESLEKQLDNENKRWKVVADQHKFENTIPQSQLDKMIEQQSNFEAKMFENGLEKYISTVGIDLHTKEIQIGLDRATVNPENKNSIIDRINELMDKNAQWHVIDSQRGSLDSCTSEKHCDPLLGGNAVSISGVGTCSNGFKATLGGVFGFVSAGHCMDNKVGNSVSDYSGHSLGTVNKETFSWGTSCDCGFVKASSSLTDNKTLLTTTSSVTVASYTSASNQSGDFIYKSGQKNAGLTYGVVTGLNQSNSGYDPSVGFFWITSLVASTASNVGGDSGGSVMGGTQSNSLYGIISGSNSSTYYHVPTDKIISVLGTAVVM